MSVADEHLERLLTLGLELGPLSTNAGRIRAREAVDEVPVDVFREVTARIVGPLATGSHRGRMSDETFKAVLGGKSSFKIASALHHLVQPLEARRQALRDGTEVSR